MPFVAKLPTGRYTRLASKPYYCIWDSRLISYHFCSIYPLSIPAFELLSPYLVPHSPISVSTCIHYPNPCFLDGFRSSISFLQKNHQLTSAIFSAMVEPSTSACFELSRSPIFGMSDICPTSPMSP